MESYPLPHHAHTAHLALFSPLSSAPQLRQRLIAASSLPDDEHGRAERRAVDFAFVDAGMITSRLHALTGVSQALLALQGDGLKTKTVHSEVLWALEPGSNITDSLKHFGLSPSTRSLLLIHLAPSPPSSTSSSTPTPTPAQEAEERRAVLARMQALVDGAPLVSLDRLGALPADEASGKGGTDEKGLRKVYKLNQEAALTGLKPGTPQHREELDRLAVSSVALKVAA
ncbi:hypothetical protein JCM10207_005130 [Rhodosporidiobolus poonsookiae]